ncbi:MAG TPA: maleylpyruvate isomerase family mycothiol-dependent enzyme [Propionibacteriaceae bacterium]|nr:maleylpyruvate isomerase family mycothiol-dependent enzyme [Propionibacteriaceae bacterium]
MAPQLSARDFPSVGGPVMDVRQRKLEATQSLLGDTIRISEQAWHEPSRLPGWTRAHVATHLARNADAVAHVITGYLSGIPTRLYGSDQARDHDIEVGADRDGLSLQIDLDTSAGELKRVFDLLPPESDAVIRLMRGIRLPLTLLPLARLHEVVLHHIDLDCGFLIDDVDAEIARWLLEWAAFRIGQDPTHPALNLHSASGFAAVVGGLGEPVDVWGPDNRLLGWLTGRADRDGLVGAPDMTFPPHG